MELLDSAGIQLLFLGSGNAFGSGADHMLVPLPAQWDAVALASASDNIPDAYRTVGPHLRKDPGASVLVVGGRAPSIGLYAAGFAAAMGASVVRYVDTDSSRLEIARALGADAIEGPALGCIGSYRITVDTSGRPQGLSCALLSTEPGGVCTSVGIYSKPTPLPLYEMYGSGVTFITGRANVSAILPEVLTSIGVNFSPQKVTTRIAGWEEAPEALLDDSAKLVIVR